MQGYGVLSRKSNYGKNYLLYYSAHQTKLINGVGILVEQNRQVNFEAISEQICKVTIKLTNSGNRFIINAFYAATLECNEKNPHTADVFYNELESVIKKGQIQRQYCYSRRFQRRSRNCYTRK